MTCLSMRFWCTFPIKTKSWQHFFHLTLRMKWMDFLSQGPLERFRVSCFHSFVILEYSTYVLGPLPIRKWSRNWTWVIPFNKLVTCPYAIDNSLRICHSIELWEARKQYHSSDLNFKQSLRMMDWMGDLKWCCVEGKADVVVVVFFALRTMCVVLMRTKSRYFYELDKIHQISWIQHWVPMVLGMNVYWPSYDNIYIYIYKFIIIYIM